VFGDVNSCCSRGRDRRKPQRAGLPYWRARPGQHVPSTRTLLLIDNRPYIFVSPGDALSRALCRVIECRWRLDPILSDDQLGVEFN
jgi:hypothetical protein